MNIREKMKNKETNEIVQKANQLYFDNDAENQEDLEEENHGIVLLDKIESIIKSYKKKVKIIEIGSGTGILSRPLFNNKQVSKVYCLDISKKCLDILKRKIEPKYQYKLVSVCSDATTFFKNSDEKFDIIFTSSSIHHIFDYDELLENAIRCLNKDGYFFIYEPMPNSYLNELLSRWTKSFDKFKGIKRVLYLCYSPFNFLSPIFYKKDIMNVEYWVYNGGLDIEKIKRLFLDNEFKIETEFIYDYNIPKINQIAKKLNSSNAFLLKCEKETLK